MPPALKKIPLVLGALYLTLCFTACAFQRSLIYHAGPPPSRDPSELGHPWHSVALTTEDEEQLQAWLIEADEPAGCILISHGNGGNIEHRLGLAHVLVDMGFSVLLYDYRGYGASTGSPTEPGLYSDGMAAYEWVRKNDWAPERIILWGESLGGAIATELATRVECGALVLDHTFTSMVEMGYEMYPWLPVSLFSVDRFETIDKLAGIKVPILVIHSPEDDLIPYEQAQELLAASHPGAVHVATEGGHNWPGFMGRALYRDPVKAFLLESVAHHD